MQQKILVSLPHEMMERQKIQITEKINKTLEPMSAEIKSWNGFVDFAEDGDGGYTVVAKCDNDEVRGKMQELINGNVAELI